MSAYAVRIAPSRSPKPPCAEVVAAYTGHLLQTFVPPAYTACSYPYRDGAKRSGGWRLYRV